MRNLSVPASFWELQVMAHSTDYYLVVLFHR